MDSVKIWKEGAEDAFDTAEKLFEAKKYHHSLFFVHLMIEKAIKGVYIIKKDSSPPPIHDLMYLAEKAGLKTTKNLKIKLKKISGFNISARYDDYKLKFYKMANQPGFAKEWYETGKNIYQDILKYYE